MCVLLSYVLVDAFHCLNAFDKKGKNLRLIFKKAIFFSQCTLKNPLFFKVFVVILTLILSDKASIYICKV